MKLISRTNYFEELNEAKTQMKYLNLNIKNRI